MRISKLTLNLSHHHQSTTTTMCNRVEPKYNTFVMCIYKSCIHLKKNHTEICANHRKQIYKLFMCERREDGSSSTIL